MSPVAPRAPLDVVVLVPTIDNAPDLERCLDALAAQTWAPFRVVVVDGRSHDRTAEIVRRHGAVHVLDDSATRADACNRALGELDCDVVVFTDDDCFPPPEWLARLVRHFDDEGVAGVGGPHVAPPDQSFWGQVVDVVFGSAIVTAGTVYMKRYPEVTETRHNPGCNAAYRKEAVERAGGFPAGSIGCEDVVLDLRIRKAGGRLLFDPEAVTHHRRRDSWRSLSRQMRSYGRARVHTNAAHPELAHPAHSAPALGLLAYPVLVVAAFLLAAVDPSPGGGTGRLVAAVQTAPLWTLGLYALLAWLGAALGTSPHRRAATILWAPLVAAVAHASYGLGTLRAWRERLAGRLDPSPVGSGRRAPGR